MAEVTLRQYCDQAKELIMADDNETAIAIGKHILRHYPKHVRTYEILGEACLEMGRYEEAADMFRRVLGADPESFIAYVGLAAVSDELGAEDEGIWQLTRALELAPGNEEVRKELQRLHAQRDGKLEERRFKLTRAALGRIYARGEEYGKAVEEFKAVLDDDPQRIDVSVALAEALWLDDKRQEAAGTCQQLLKDLPYCLKANLILADILLRAGREGEAQALLQRAQALDPENTVAQELFGYRSPLPARTVVITALEEEAVVEEEEVAEERRPEVAEPGLLEEWEEAPAEEELPAWLQELQDKAIEKEAEAPVVMIGEEEIEKEEEVGPSWLAGEVLEEERAEEVGELEEVPQWVRELQREVEEEEVAAEPEEEVEEKEIPDWLRRLREEEGPPPEEVRAEEAAPEEEIEEEEEIPDWLRRLRQEEVPPPVEVRAEEAAPEAAGVEAVVEAPPEKEVIPEAEELTLEAPPEAEAPPEPAAEKMAEKVVSPEEEIVLAPPPPAEEATEEDRLILARTLVETGDRDAALEQYRVLVEAQSPLLDQVVVDLEGMAEADPDHLMTHQLLGDAYARTGRLKEAVEKYRWVLDRT